MPTLQTNESLRQVPEEFVDTSPQLSPVEPEVAETGSFEEAVLADCDRFGIPHELIEDYYDVILYRIRWTIFCTYYPSTALSGNFDLKIEEKQRKLQAAMTQNEVGRASLTQYGGIPVRRVVIYDDTEHGSIVPWYLVSFTNQERERKRVGLIAELQQALEWEVA